MNIQKALDELEKHYHQEIVKGGLSHMDDLHAELDDIADIFSVEAYEVFQQIRWHEDELLQLGVCYVSHNNH